jgi:hypothetical protein
MYLAQTHLSSAENPVTKKLHDVTTVDHDPTAAPSPVVGSFDWYPQPAAVPNRSITNGFGSGTGFGFGRA